MTAPDHGRALRDHIADLSDRLRPWLPDIALRHWGEPASRGRTEWRWGEHGRRVVHVAGPRQGRWHDFGAGMGGDAFALLARELGSRDAAIEEARRWVGGDRPAPVTKRVTNCDMPPTRTTLVPAWRAFWDACLPIEPETLAASYLLARGCVLPPEDGDLRWHPACRHPGGYEGPALVGRITDARDASRALSLHRTWIRPDGAKADVHPPRLLLKDHAKAGGVIRLWPDDRVTTGLAIGEGVETGLAAARRFTPVWACVDAGNLAAFPVLDGLESLSVFVDHDKAGIKAALAVGQRWRKAAREARVFFPDREGMDWADVETGGPTNAR